MKKKITMTELKEKVISSESERSESEELRPKKINKKSKSKELDDDSEENEKESKEYTNRCNGLTRDKTQCQSKKANDSNFCDRYHSYMNDYTPEELKILKFCCGCKKYVIDLKNCIFCKKNSKDSKSKEPDDSEKSEKDSKVDINRCNGLTRDKTQCQSKKAYNSNYCGRYHSYMNEYTPEELKNLTFCWGCAKYVPDPKNCVFCEKNKKDSKSKELNGSKEPEKESDMDTNRCKGLTRKKTQCQSKKAKNSNYCSEYHSYMNNYTPEELKILQYCWKCQKYVPDLENCIMCAEKNKDIDEDLCKCGKEKKVTGQTKCKTCNTDHNDKRAAKVAPTKCIFENNDKVECTHLKLDNQKFCGAHIHMYYYTEDMILKSKKCSGCSKYTYYRPCDTCKLNIDVFNKKYEGEKFTDLIRNITDPNIKQFYDDLSEKYDHNRVDKVDIIYDKLLKLRGDAQIKQSHKCFKKECKFKPIKEGCCGNHFNEYVRTEYTKLMKEKGIIVCSRTMRCNTLNEIDPSNGNVQCEECRESGREKDAVYVTKKRLTVNEINELLKKQGKNNEYRACVSCNIPNDFDNEHPENMSNVYPIKQFDTLNGNDGMNCEKCREKNRNNEKTRNPEVRKLSARRRDKTRYPKRQAKRKEWRLANPLLAKEMDDAYRKTRIEKYGVDAYLARNAAVMKIWRENNPDKVKESYLQQYSNPNRKLTDYRKRCIVSGIKWSLTDENAIKLFESDCYYCNNSGKYGICGIDRKDNFEDYTNSNCVSCCDMCNYMKHLDNDKMFIGKIQHILNHMKIIQDPDYKYQNILSDSCSDDYYGYKSRAINRKKLIFDITIEEYEKLCSEECYMCGKVTCKTHVNGIDRIDNNIGYNKDNCLPCCYECNKLKGEYEIKDLICKMCEIYYTHFDESYGVDYDEICNKVTEYITDKLNDMKKIYSSKNYKIKTVDRAMLRHLRNKRLLELEEELEVLKNINSEEYDNSEDINNLQDEILNIKKLSGKLFNTEKMTYDEREEYKKKCAIDRKRNLCERYGINFEENN